MQQLLGQSSPAAGIACTSPETESEARNNLFVAFKVHNQILPSSLGKSVSLLSQKPRKPETSVGSFGSKITGNNGLLEKRFKSLR
jgi:hypothetical protein